MKGAAFVMRFVVYECHWLHKDKVIAIYLVKACTMFKRNAAVKDKQGGNCDGETVIIVKKINSTSTLDLGFFKETNLWLSKEPHLFHQKTLNTKFYKSAVNMRNV